MAEPTVRDIFEGVFRNTKRSFISSFDYAKVKSKTVQKNGSEDENISVSRTSSPYTETRIEERGSSDASTETVRESIERVNETEVVSKIRKELEEKFPYALGAVCGNLATLDMLYRSFKVEDPQGEFSDYFIDVTDSFPLCERFAHPCTMYVCSMVLSDVDAKQSDAFYDKYVRAVKRIAAEIPFECADTVEKYPY